MPALINLPLPTSQLSSNLRYLARFAPLLLLAGR